MDSRFLWKRGPMLSMNRSGPNDSFSRYINCTRRVSSDCGDDVEAPRPDLNPTVSRQNRDRSLN
jgi:hypothetical protein